MKCRMLLLLAVLAAGCDDDEIGGVIGHSAQTSVVGVWSGFEEITTAEDPGSNTGSPADRGFSFPVLLEIRSDGRFTLITSGFSTSFDEESDRTCSGFWTREGHTISFFPVESCRALPMTRYVVGVAAPTGITLNASTGSQPFTSPVTMRVFIRLDRA